jgi:hypothetical protein
VCSAVRGQGHLTTWHHTLHYTGHWSPQHLCYTVLHRLTLKCKPDNAATMTDCTSGNALHSYTTSHITDHCTCTLHIAQYNIYCATATVPPTALHTAPHTAPHTCVHCTTYCTLHCACHWTLQSTLHSAQYTLYCTLHSTLPTAQYALCAVHAQHCTLHTAQCRLHTAHCTVYTVLNIPTLLHSHTPTLLH